MLDIFLSRYGFVFIIMNATNIDLCLFRTRKIVLVLYTCHMNTMASRSVEKKLT